MGVYTLCLYVIAGMLWSWGNIEATMQNNVATLYLVFRGCLYGGCTPEKGCVYYIYCSSECTWLDLSL